MPDDQPDMTAWTHCTIGSCQRHQRCMYTPCRSVKGELQPTDNEYPEEAALGAAYRAGIAAERERCAKIARDLSLKSHKDFRWLAEEIEAEIQRG